MRKGLPALLLMLSNCTVPAPDGGVDEVEFRALTEAFQEQYLAGGSDCDGLLSHMAGDVAMIENGSEWDRDQIAEYCPYLPAKRVVDSWADVAVLSPNLAQDFVTVVYTNAEMEYRRETTVRVWRNAEDGWKIVRMSSVLSAILPEVPEG